MASELELAGLLSQVEDDAGDEEIFAAQWQQLDAQLKCRY